MSWEGERERQKQDRTSSCQLHQCKHVSGSMSSSRRPRLFTGCDSLHGGSIQVIIYIDTQHVCPFLTGNKQSNCMWWMWLRGWVSHGWHLHYVVSLHCFLQQRDTYSKSSTLFFFCVQLKQVFQCFCFYWYCVWGSWFRLVKTPDDRC